MILKCMRMHNANLEDVALEVVMSSVRKNVLSRYIRSCGHACLPRLVHLASLMCGMDWWPSGRISVSAFSGRCFYL